MFTSLQSPPLVSSFAASWVSAELPEPRYAPSRVSNDEPCVCSRRLPLDGAVQAYQTDARPLDDPWLGSPASRLAPMVVPVTLPLVPVIGCR